MSQIKYNTVFSIPSVKKNGYELIVQPVLEGVAFERDKDIEFTVSVTKDGEPFDGGEVHAFYKWNSEKILWHSNLKIQSGKTTFNFQISWPGFGNVHVYLYIDGEEILEQIRGVAVSPDLLKRSFPCPNDFDSFWAEKKNRISSKMDVFYKEVTKDSHPHLHDSHHKALLETDISKVDIDYVTVESEVGNVEGVLTRPKKRSPKSLSAVVYCHGAGVRASMPDRFVDRVNDNLMIFEINAHGIPNDQKPEYYEKLKEGKLKDYHTFGRESRDTIYYVDMFLRVKKALDFMMSLKEWDGQVLITMGGSQGAAQGYAGGYLVEEVTAIVVGIPAYGDLTGFLCGRKVNWGEDWLKLGERGRLDPKIMSVAPYIDSVNFLKDYKRDLCVAIGLLDQGCMPTTNFVPIAECPSPNKTVILESDVYHRICDEANERQWEYVSNHIKKTKKS